MVRRSTEAGHPGAPGSGRPASRARGAGSETPPGILLVDKSTGPTSHDVVARARRCLGTRRVGHTGTLDPFATGLLLLCVGRATRLAEYFHLLDKAYEATLRLGTETDTHDVHGEVRSRSDAWRDVTVEEVDRALSSWVGEVKQRPPAFSAKRVGGRRAHRLARTGREASLPPVSVTVHALERVVWDPPELRLRVRASTGTYVRALARDLGQALGCGAHLVELRRTAIGPFRVEDAVGEERLREAGPADPPGSWGRAWRTPADALAWLPARGLDEEEERRVVSGLSVPASGVRPPAGPVEAEEALPVALVREGRLVAVAERRDGVLQPRKVLAGP